MAVEQFIDGVYNYCDRWCERCRFASRCRVFSRLDGPREAEMVEGMGEAWEYIEEAHRAVLESLFEQAGERGIDLEPHWVEQERRLLEERLEEAKSDPLIRQAEGYSGAAGEWLGAAEPLIRQVAAVGGAEELDEALQVVQHFQFQILTKLFRAMRADGLGSDHEREDPRSDANGSVKVALIGIDRSIGAWGVLRRRVFSEEDGVLDLLLRLERLRKGAEQAFPLARSFIRPGFDFAAVVSGPTLAETRSPS